MIPGYSLSTLGNFVGRELGLSHWISIDQARIQAFADCTDDPQWIHVDVERCARESPFGAPIAHGFLTLSLLTPMLGEVGVIPAEASRAINSGLSNLRFRSPVRVGSRVRGRLRLADVQAKGEGRWLITINAVVEIEDEKDPALSADMIVMLFA